MTDYTDVKAVANDAEGLHLYQAFLCELTGTTLLMLFGTGVGCNCKLVGSPGRNDPWLTVCVGWAFAVFVGGIVASKSGAHLNPSLTLAFTIFRCLKFGDGATFAAGVPISIASFATYVAGQFSGAFLGSLLAYLAFKKHFDEEKQDPATIRGIFCTAPAIRSLPWNFVTEAIATAALVFTVFAFAHDKGGWSQSLGPLATALVILTIGIGLGGPTGFSLNPTRDLAPRILHAMLPIPCKSHSDWSYAPIPIFGPITGAVFAGFLAYAYSPI